MRKFILLFLLWNTPAFATIQPWCSTSNISATATAFIAPMGSYTINTTVGNVSGPAPTDGAIIGVQMYVQTDPGTSSDGWTINFYKNGADGNVTCTFVGGSGAGSCTDPNDTHSDSVAQGDILAWHITKVSAAVNSRLMVCGYFRPTTADENAYIATSGSAALGVVNGGGAASTNYWPIVGTYQGGTATTTESTNWAINGLAGTLKKGCWLLKSHTGVGATRGFSVSVSASTSGTPNHSFVNGDSNTVPICDNSTTSSVSAGNTLSMSLSNPDNAPAASTGSWSFVILASTTGQWQLVGGTAQRLITQASGSNCFGLSNFDPGSGSGLTSCTLETRQQIILPVGMKFTSFYAKVDTAPGATDTNCALREKITIDLRRNGNTAANNFQLTICGTQTANNVSGEQFTVANDFYAAIVIPSATLTPPTGVRLALTTVGIYASPAASCKYFVYQDFHNGTNGVAPTQADVEPWGITGVHSALSSQTGAVLYSSSTPPHTTAVGPYSALCVNNFPGTGGNSTMGLAVTASAVDPVYGQNYINNVLWTLGGSGSVAPADTASTMGAFSYYFQTDAPSTATLNIDSFNMRMASGNYLNMAVKSAGADLRMSIEGACNASAQIVIAANTRYHIVGQVSASTSVAGTTAQLRNATTNALIGQFDTLLGCTTSADTVATVGIGQNSNSSNGVAGVHLYYDQVEWCFSTLDSSCASLYPTSIGPSYSSTTIPGGMLLRGVPQKIGDNHVPSPKHRRSILPLWGDNCHCSRNSSTFKYQLESKL